MAKRKKRAGKGTFGDLDLSVAERYVRPAARSRAVWLGLAAGIVLLVLVLADFRFGRARLLSGGRLSSSHASLVDDCAACHAATAGVTDGACSACHEKYGDELGDYTFAAHYVYRSNDFQRVVPSPEEQPCAACHPEHEGRTAGIIRVDDGRCLVCHDYGSFNRDHPEFDFAAEGAGDADSLAFAHLPHVRELMKRRRLQDVEQACLACHEPAADGRSFEPISFDRHCDACHLTASERTPALPIGSQTGGPGVATLAEIQQRGGAAARWSYFLSPSEFRQLGDRVVKTPLYHRDPWVLENLRALRRRLYPNAGLADLLTTSADVQPGELGRLYREATAQLEASAEALRARPEPQIQAEVREIEEQLELLRRRLENPYTPLDETAFLLALGERDPDLPAAEEAAITQVVAALTTPCSPCHRVENATIARVTADQRTLQRAEFDHRSHILARRCLDCHTQIPLDLPLEELLAAETKLPPELDRSGIHNLPRIAQCRECHNPQAASNRCVTCHLFHPDKDRRRGLLLYADAGG